MASPALVEQVSVFVQQFMSQYDASHDYAHILRVLSLAHHIARREDRTYDLQLVTLGALLHDVGDKKYLKPGQRPETMVYDELRRFGADEQLATTVQTLCLNVSYSNEVKQPQRVADLIEKLPELAVVQDADRLDAIGAVGIGRTFTFGGAKPVKSTEGPPVMRAMDDTIDHFHEKLERLHGMMKTDTGRMLAKERTERLLTFRSWWEEETSILHIANELDGVAT